MWVKTLHTGSMATPEVEPLPAARTIALAIAAALRADITAGRLRAGDRLLQTELARRFDVSTTPVREAFGILQHEGLVRLHPQRGATVFVPSVEELQEHYEIRAALEALAAEKAALNFTAADAPPLQSAPGRPHQHPPRNLRRVPADPRGRGCPLGPARS